MSAGRGILLAVILLGVAGGYVLFAPPRVAETDLPASAEALERGAYLVAAGGCISCHAGVDDPESLSGGLALETAFGVFHAPNITPHPETGIGGWSGRDFVLALKHGRSPGGSFYYPAFPYPAYAGMTDADALAIGAYLLSLDPVEATAPPHELPGWLMRWTVAGWNLLAGWSEPGFPEEADPQKARGAYLARHLGHCGECHTPRNGLGILDQSREFAGGELPEGKVEAIDGEALADWSADDFMLLLNLGLKPDGDFVGGKMEAVIAHNTSRLSLEDKQALTAFFLDQSSSTR
jgi:mono/diheme cytochrome c family protein